MVAVAPAESLSVELTGRGDPVVLIPGLFGSAFGFRKLVPLLVTAGYRTIVIEPLGVGSSGRPEKANYSLTAQADRIAAVLDSLHVRRALVLAHSGRGRARSRRHPQGVSRDGERPRAGAARPAPAASPVSRAPHGRRRAPRRRRRSAGGAITGAHAPRVRARFVARRGSLDSRRRAGRGLGRRRPPQNERDR